MITRQAIRATSMGRTSMASSGGQMKARKAPILAKAKTTNGAMAVKIDRPMT